MQPMPTSMPCAASLADGAPLHAPEEILPLVDLVERQLDDLRQAQSGHEQWLAQAQQRSQVLDAAEQRLHQQWVAFEQREHLLQAAAAEVERRSAALAAIESTHGFDRMEWMRRARDLESFAQAQCIEQQALQRIAGELAERQSALESERAALRGEVEELRRRRRELEASLDASLGRIEEERRRAARRREERDELQTRLRSTNTRLEEAERELELAKRRSDEARGEAERLRQENQTLEQRLAQVRAELESAGRMRHGELEALAIRAKELEASLAAQRRPLEEAETALRRATEAEAALAASQERHRGEIRSLQASLAAAEAAMRSEREARLAADRKLAEAGAGTERRDLEQQIDTLRRRVEQGDARTAALRRELEQSEESLREQTSRVRALQRQLDARPEASEGESLRDELARVQESLKQATVRCTELQAGAERAEAERTAAATRVADLERQLESLRSERASVVSTPAPAADPAAEAEALRGLRGEVAALSARLVESEARASELQRRLEQRREGGEEREPRGAETARVDPVVLQEKVRQLARFAGLLRSRRERLRKVRAALETRRRRLAASAGTVAAAAAQAPTGTATAMPVASVAGGAMLEELRQVQAKREELRQVQKFLADSEARMVRRWAVQKASTVAMLFTLFLGAISAAGWMASELIWPVSGSASVDLVARGGKGPGLEPAVAEGWRKWHLELLKDPAFLNKVAGRLAVRGLAPADAASLGSLLSSDLAVDSDGPGRLRLVLSGSDRQALPPLLDTVATTLAAESLAAAPRRPDATPAVVIGERTRDGKLAYSLLDPRPIEMEQVQRAGIVGGGLLGLALVVGVPTALLLRRSKRVMPQGTNDAALA